jgi:multiple sugar transport system ATP-binding protein
MATVKLEGVTRQFGQTLAVENISFEVPNGEFWVLVGPSGCGKSTILRTVAGLEAITEGNLYIDNQLVNDISARERDVAMVFQNYALYPHMTVAENLGFGLKMRQVDGEIIKQKIDHIAHILNIEHLLKRKPKQLSGGQQQRVALGRAIIREPKAFLLDEPLSNLDAQLREETRTELKQLHTKMGITTIYVTHDQVEAMTLADKIVVLNQGKIQQIGTPQEIYSRPANMMVATFIGNPQMNISPATYMENKLVISENQGFTINHQLKQRLKPRQGEGFDVGIRPESLRLVPASEISNNLPQLMVEVNLVEPLGKETVLKVNLLESDLIFNFIAPFDWQGKIGDRLTLQFNLEDLFIFDRSTGCGIY